MICERLLFLCRADPSPTLNYWLDESRPPFIRSFFCFLDDPKQLTYQVCGHERKNQEFYTYVRNCYAFIIHFRKGWETMDDLRLTDDPNAPQISDGQINFGSVFSCDNTQATLSKKLI